MLTANMTRPAAMSASALPAHTAARPAAAKLVVRSARRTAFNSSGAARLRVAVPRHSAKLTAAAVQPVAAAAAQSPELEKETSEALKLPVKAMASAVLAAAACLLVPVAAHAAAPAAAVLSVAALEPVGLVTAFWGALYYSFLQIAGTAKMVVAGQKQITWAERTFGNLVEQSPVFLAAMWAYAVFVSPTVAAQMGIAWLGFRLLYPVLWAAKGEMNPMVFVSTMPSYAINIFLLASTVAKVALGVVLPTSAVFLGLPIFVAGAIFQKVVIQKAAFELFDSTQAVKTGTSPVTEQDVLLCQENWANAITSISKTYLEKGDYIGAAGEAAGELYGYGHSNVLFKPTKAAEYPFRPTGGEAMSYFVGGGVVDNGYYEDAGFAINGGKGWSKVVFTNHQIDYNGSTATAMGSYVFTCATTGSETKVEYTFGYKRNEDGKCRIFLHHSSVPYAAATGPEPISEAEVLACQAGWVNAIKTISKIYLEEGDYIAAAGKAAGELYGYGHSNVLFKPTKAAEYPFRPTGGEAMSYFVGGSVVDNGYDEDAGFAINGGKGWSDVVFTNHQIDYNGIAAVAMGSYVFTCATTGDKAKVEYTFGYKRNEDGKPRIFLHHSSVPYAA